MVLALAACVPLTPETPGAGTCGADAAQGLVGQPASVVQTMRFGQTVRILRPGDAVTMDYSAARLNIEIDARQRVVRVGCG